MVEKGAINNGQEKAIKKRLAKLYLHYLDFA